MLSDTTKPLVKKGMNVEPYYLKAIYDYISLMLTKEQLLKFLEGTLFDDNIVSVYLKILETLNVYQLITAYAISQSDKAYSTMTS